MKPRLLDLFCGAGGAAKGYQNAGFYVVGIDIKPMPRYCGDEFHQADALEYLAEHGAEFDAIHASPPCQGYSRLRHLPWLKDKVYPLLIDPTRELLEKTGKPWVIENVEDSPLVGVVLCGLMFGLPVYRHRKFETSFFMLQPPHQKHEIVIGHGSMINDRRKGSLNAGSGKGAWGNQKIITVAGGQFLKEDGALALQIDWMIKTELAQAIPPGVHGIYRPPTQGDIGGDMSQHRAVYRVQTETGVEALLMQLRVIGMAAPEREYRFHPVRRWLFDLAWPEKKIAVEVEGAVWKGGRHTRGGGYEKDCIKYNEAQLLGWRVYRFSTGQVLSGEAIEFLERAMEV